MLPAKSTSLEDLPAVTGKAVDLATRLLEDDITRWRFKFGRQFVIAALGVFFAGHFAPFASYFTGDFPAHAWIASEALFGLGAAFSGKEVIESLVAAAKSTTGK
jgi:hypothetical protein